VIEQSIGVQVETDERVRKSKLLNILILSLSVAVGVFLVVVLTQRLPSMLPSLISIVSALVICGVSYWLIRLNKFYLAAYLFLGGFIIVANTSALLPGAPLETRIVGPFFYSLSVMAAGILIGPLAAFWFAGFGATILLIIVAVLGGSAFFTPGGGVAMGWAALSAPIVFSLILASMSWLFANSINNAFSALAQRSEKLRASEEELRASNEELQTTIDELGEANAYNEGLMKSMVDGLGVLDLGGKVIDVNAPLLGMMGLKKEEIVGLPLLQSLGSVVEPTEIEKVSAIIGQLMAGVPVGATELVITTKDGTRVTISIAPSVVRDAKGKPIMLFAVMRDISERKRMEQEIQEKNEQLNVQNEELRATEEELRASNEELEAANEELTETQEQLVRSERLAAIGQLAGGVGHELRNPLGAIKNAVYYVKGKVVKSELAQKEPRVTEFLDIVDEEVNASNKIINDLLGFSRVGKPAVSLTRVKKVIEDALSRIPVPENIELTKRLDADLTEIEIDSDQIQQVLVNIVTNAAQAMPEGGKLTIGVREKGGFLEMGITDTGGGIPEEVRNKIFEPLFTTRAKGIGLGLAVCKSIIDRHGGHIEVKSKVGEGTTFNIKLPLKAA